MKSFLVFTSLVFLPSYSLANDTSALIEGKKEINRTYETMTCSELKKGLLEIAEDIAEFEYIEQNSVEFKLNIYALKKSLEKASSCID